MIKPWQEYQAIYVHIPFCVQKCLYCDFASYARCGEKTKQQYVEALCKEIAIPLELPINPKATIYFGGGTPSTLSVEQLAHIVGLLKAKRLWQNPAEATIEVNPGTVDLAKLKALRELGFDRISMGVQSLNNEELRTIGRIHTAQEALEAIAMAKSAGFERINADVIYGLPGQSLASVKQTLETLVKTAIDHISVYGLIVEEGTPLAALVDSGKLVLPEEDEAADMYDYVQVFLEQQGFVRYEVSNYARARAADNRKTGTNKLDLISCSRHNDVYWKYQPYAAFGASAASFDGKCRYTRPATIDDYIAWIGELGNTKICREGYEEIAEPLNNEELLSEFMMMGLRRLEGANLQEARERFGIDILKRYEQELQPFFQQQLIKYDEATKRLFLTSAGMAIGNKVFAIFV